MPLSAPATTVVQNPPLKQVVGVMRTFALKGADSVRLPVESICRNLEPGDYASEILACYYWVCSNIRYMRDPYDAELVKDPLRVLQTGAGDCDDIAVLLAAMCLALGNRVSFAIVSFSYPPIPTHVFVIVHGPKGENIVLDPVANVATPSMVARIKSIALVPLIYEADRSMGDETDGVVANSTVASRTFSVYDYGTRQFNYYQGLAAVPSSGWLRAPKGRQAAPEVLAARLPVDARHIGSGAEARGIIATTQSGMGNSISGKEGSSTWFSGPVKSLVLVFGGLLAGFVIGKKKGK